MTTRDSARASHGAHERANPLRDAPHPLPNVGPVERAVSGAAAAALLAFGASRRSRTALAAVPVGAYLAYRAVTGRDVLYGVLGIERAAGRVQVARSFTVNRDAAELYAFWRDLSNLPSVMRHLESVTALDATRSRWVAKGPAGSRVTWDADIVEDREDQFILWRSTPGSSLRNEGSVRFVPAPGGRGTEVRVQLEYAAPAGSAGVAVAKLVGAAPEFEVQEDLRRFKATMEAGHAARVDGQSHGHAVSRVALLGGRR